MGRGAKPPKAKAKRPAARKSPGKEAAKVHELEKRLAEALEQQTATSAILRVISRSQTDVQPVFDAILDSAVRLLRAYSGALSLIAGEQIELAALTGTDEAGDAAVRALFPQSLQSEGANAQAVRDRSPVNIADYQTDPRVPEAGRANARVRGYRSVVVVPLLRHAAAVGAITVTRRESGGFTDDEIALLQAFADQAVIAVENARLLTELQQQNEALTQAHAQVSEALEQQTATSEILRVISSSPTDEQPVFDAIVQSARRLCDANFSGVFLAEAGQLILAAVHGLDSAGITAVQGAYPRPVARDTTSGRAVMDRRIVHIEDTWLDPEYTHPLRDTIALRSVLTVPIFREELPIGAISVWRGEARPFTDKQVELLQTFADQAVIAVENVRLLTELQASNRELTTALDTQTATSDILRVISRSQTDAQPVFDAIVVSAVRLLGAYTGVLTRLAGDQIALAAITSTDAAGDAALRAAYPQSLRSEDPFAQAMRDRVPLNVADTETDPRLPEAARAYTRARGYRSAVIVPLLRHDEAVGAIAVSRRAPGGFTDDEIALLETFADQAVIAIENARLLTELQQRNQALTQAHAQVTTALEQQTATSEILRVISRSQTDVQPVFDTIVRSAVRLCDGLFSALYRFDGTLIHQVAQHNFTPEALEEAHHLYPARPTRGLGSARAILECAVVQVPDVEADPEYQPQALSQAIGFRAGLWVPMLREGTPIGVIFVGFAVPGPFSDTEIELLKTFADQAVIAVENVRLFTELQASNRELTTALDTQTATSDILRVISGSRTNVQPVFDAILDSAVRLLRAYSGALSLIAGEQIELAALTGTDEAGDAAVRALFPQSLQSEGANAQAVRDRSPVNIADYQTDPRVPEAGRANARVRGYRSVVVVPLLRHAAAVGAITVTRRESGGFTDDEIALLRTFADQAVIAIENSRLLTELQERNEALTEAHARVSEALEQQMATSEILRVISRSQTDVRPVFDTIVRSAVRLCDGLFSALYQFDGELIRQVAQHNYTSEALEELRHRFPARPTRALHTGRAILERAVVHISDVEIDPEFQLLGLTRAIGMRSGLFVPMLREGAPIGVIAVGRAEPGSFSDTQIELLKIFADQAVIAVENVRLFTELQASNRELTTALDQQTATSDILRVISRSHTNVQPVFDTILASAVRLLGAYSGALTRIAGEQIELAAHTSTDDAGDAALRAAFPRSLQSEEPHGQAIRERAPLNIVDAHTDPRLRETARAYARARGYRSWVVVPLLRHDEAIGGIAVTRRDPGGFTGDEVALLETFADQAVIAIENARLLTELQARTHELTRSVEQLTALGDVGRAVSSSLDLDTVLTTIVGRAVQLSGTDGGTIFEYDEGAEEFLPRATLNADESQSAMLRATRLRRGEGAVGQMAVTREPIQIPDIAAEGAYESRLRGALLEAGTRALLAIPLLHEDRIVGGLVVSRLLPGAFTAEVVEILKTFATQSALAIRNARLFHEIERKSRELEVASQHKSEFLASMSHELRTPLNAIIGFSDVLLEGMFGETNEKQTEYLRDILASGQHLLSLINDILDLSKIEAGRMELDVAAFDLPAAIDDAMLLMRERAGRRGITLERHLDERVGELHGDQRKVKQVLLNLLSNAVKFTLEGGRIDVRVGLANETTEISVTDTGIGIAPEDHDAVFEEFRQVGAAERKAEGTGLGLALCRKFVELHGGRIWVKSRVGVGSTFTFTLPRL